MMNIDYFEETGISFGAQAASNGFFGQKRQHNRRLPSYNPEVFLWNFNA